jgi:WD40 repeat protein/serine/threonine protein kinase
MTIASSNNLVTALRDSRLLTPSQLNEATLELQARFPEPRALARELVQRGWLTPFQINQLFQGRTSELMLGPYLLLERLGEGGMGQVFKARHQLMNRLVALKLIRKERLSAPNAVRRFYREVEGISRLAHPNIVMAYDVAQFGEAHVFVMEYVEGTDLSRLVKLQGPLPVAVACSYTRQAALGLQHAHEHGIVHRDIKPANLLVTSRGGVIKVLDMGLARLQQAGDGDDQSSQLTQEGSVMGTPDYIAPEQALDSHSVDIRSDIYSLGCTLYYLLTRQVPFPGGTLGEKLVKHQLKEPQPVEQIRPEVPAALAAVVRKMMAKRPSDRYQTPAELAQALEPFSHTEDAGGVTMATIPEQAAPAFPAALPAVPVVFDHTIDPNAPLALPVSGPPTKRGAVHRLWEIARARPWLTATVGSVALAGLVACLMWLLHSGPGEKPSRSKKKDVVKNEPEPPVVVLGGEPGRHWGAVRCVAFHPKEPSAASGGDDNVIRLWDTANLQEEGVLRAHKASVNCLAFSPDGENLLSGGEDGLVCLWDVTRRKTIRKFTSNHGAVTAVAFSPDGGKILAGCGGGTAVLFALQSGENKGELTEGSGQVRAVAFDRSGKQAVTAGDDTFLRLWDVEGKKRIFRLEGHKDVIWSAAFSRDGRRIVSGSKDKSVRLWGAAKGKQIAAQENLAAEVRAVAFSHDGRLALSGGLDKTLSRWDGKSLRPRGSWPAGSGAVGSVAFSPDDRRALSGGEEQLVRLWDVKKGRELLPRAGHTRAVRNLVFSQDGKLLLSAGADQTVRLWDLAGSKERFVFPVETSAFVYLAFIPETSQVIYRQGPATLRVANTVDGLPSSTLTLGANFQETTRMIVTPGGAQALCCANYRSAFLLNLNNANTIDFDQHMDAPVRSIALSPDGRWGLSGGNDWKIWLFELERKQPSRPFAGHTDVVLGLAFLPDGKTALSVGADRAVWRWDLAGKERTRLFELPAGTGPAPGFNAPAFAPDGRFLATCDDAGHVRLYSLASGKKVKGWGNSGPVNQVTFAPDGRRLAAANASGTISIYPVPAAD